MTPRTLHDDEFEQGFEADDDFALDHIDPWAHENLGDDAFLTPAGGGAPSEAEDFLGRAPEDIPAEEDAFDLDANPVGVLIADAEAALGEPASPEASSASPPPSASFSGQATEANVPRINIHVFCAVPETAETAAKAAADRRMTKASTTVHSGGLAGAVEYYQNQPTPSLVIVESTDPAPVLLGLLDDLAEVCDSGTKVVVIGHANDIALYRALVARGVSEYLVAPLQTLGLINAVSTLYADPSAPFIGRSIAFVGAKGGVGASTIAHNFAYALTERIQTTAVVADFDLPFGTAGLDFNQDPLQGVADALSQPERLDPVLLERMMARCTDRLSLFAAPATLEDDYDITPDAYEEVATKIRSTAPFVIMDLPHLWSGWMRRTLLSADEVVIVATPDLASLRNAKNMIDLIRQARPNDAPPRLVLNQVGVPGRPEIPAKDFAAALDIDPSLILPFDPKLFGQAANNGQMLAEVNAKSKVVEGFEQLAQIISRRDPPPAPKKTLLAGLFKK